MTLPAFLKKKKTYVILAIILVLGLWIVSCARNSGKTQYETDTVKKMNLKRTVEVTGNVKPADRISLSFQQSGTLSKVVKVGDYVKMGDVIAELKDDDASYAVQKAKASLDQAKANLSLKIIGETNQSVRISETAVEQAQAAYNKSLVDYQNSTVTTQNSIQSAQLALDNAKSNLANGSQTNSQTVTQARATLQAALAASVGPMNTSLTDGDKITGVEGNGSNSAYKNLLGALDSRAMNAAQASFHSARESVSNAEILIGKLPSISTDDGALFEAAKSTENALALLQAYLTDVHHVLDTTIPGTALSSADISTKTSTIDTDRASVSTQNNTIVNDVQAVTTAEIGIQSSGDTFVLAVSNAELALQTAKSNAETAVNAASSTVAINKAALDSAKAALDLKKSPPREADLAPFRAAVEQANAAYLQAQSDLSKGMILAPVNGVVSDVTPSVGELVSQNVPVISMLGDSTFDIEVLLPEADVAKVVVGQKATMTFDAFGDTTAFDGSVVSIEPDQTVVQDAIYYKSRVEVTDTQAKDIKPGMTANVTILTAESDGVLTIQSRAIKTDSSNNKKTVQILVNGKPQEREVQIGLKGDEGLVEITSGLQEGETIIVSTTTQ
jgi:RND family efflux transporter MFP subunit